MVPCIFDVQTAARYDGRKTDQKNERQAPWRLAAYDRVPVRKRVASNGVSSSFSERKGGVGVII